MSEYQIQPLSDAVSWYDKSTLQPSQVTNLFFTPQNIEYLQAQLELILQRLTNEKVCVPVTPQFMQGMTEIAKNNPILAYLQQEGLEQLNSMFLEWEARILLVSLREHKLYDKYFIRGDRMRVFPHGAAEKVTKGEVQIVPSGYLMSNPWRRQYDNFLSDVLCIKKT